VKSRGDAATQAVFCHPAVPPTTTNRRVFSRPFTFRTQPSEWPGRGGFPSPYRSRRRNPTRFDGVSTLPGPATSPRLCEHAGQQRGGDACGRPRRPPPASGRVATGRAAPPAGSRRRAPCPTRTTGPRRRGGPGPTCNPGSRRSATRRTAAPTRAPPARRTPGSGQRSRSTSGGGSWNGPSAGSTATAGCPRIISTTPGAARRGSSPPGAICRHLSILRVVEIGGTPWNR
jgi:hypothetical protein